MKIDRNIIHFLKVIPQAFHTVLEEAGEPTYDKTGAPSKLNGMVQNITDLKRSEEQLLIRNAALESSISAIGLADLDGKLIYANKAFVNLWGYIDVQEMLGKHITEFISSMDQLLEALKLIMGGNGYIDERESLKKDGTKFVVQVSANLVTNPDGKPICLMVSFADITERKQIEKAMKLNEEKLKELFEKAPVGYHEIDKLGNITAVNQTELKMLGYTFEQMIGWSVWEFVTDREESRKIILAKLAGNLPPYKNSEQTFTRADGTSFPALVDDVILRNERGEITGIRSTILDITDRKRAEEAVRESEEKFRMVFENVLDGISIYSEDPDPSKRRLIECNERYASMAGRSCEELLQLGSTLGLQRTLEDTTNNNRLESLARGTVYQGSFSWIRPDGKDNIIEFVGKPIIWQGKQYTIGIDRDITERKRMEEQLRQMQKLDGLGTLAGGIAHDFNNILGIILAYITSIKHFKEDTKKLDFAINTITKAVDRGKTLVQQILTFARKSGTEFGAVNVNDLVIEIMAMIFETFPKIITYAQNFDKTIPLINADRSQLHQALLNLCVNARDAMPSGGVLTINTRMVSSISLRNQHPDALASSYVCIEVSDTGVGMNDEIRKHIYDPFFTTRKKGEGTGLGLAVVFGVIQTHKGFIDVESELGKGTTFHLYLPASYVTEPIGVKDKEMVEEIPGGTETLLVVEDEETLMMSLQIVLAEKGYSVLSAADGMEALDIYKERKNEIALILTDLGLPKMTGMEEFQRIKQINPSARIIVATGFLDPEMKSELLKAGAKGFVQKPYSPDEILRKIREVLDESHE